jgi:hypothetical protein
VRNRLTNVSSFHFSYKAVNRWDKPQRGVNSAQLQNVRFGLRSEFAMCYHYEIVGQFVLFAI